MTNALNLKTWWAPDVSTPCAETDPDMWFPAPGPWQTAARAKALCLECPVIAECLRYADAIRPTAGIWGGVHFPRRGRGL